MNEFYAIAIDADAIARAIAYAIEQPGDFDVKEMIIRPNLRETIGPGDILAFKAIISSKIWS